VEAEEKAKLEAELVRLKEELEERTASIPIHSIRPHQLIEIEELEDRIQEIAGELDGADD
jgi:hypothetical protein